MSLTTNLTLLKRKKRKDGTIPIYIRLTENRTSRYRSTGIAVKPGEWNAKRQEVNAKHRQQNHLNMRLSKQLREIQELQEKLYKEDKLTMDGIMAELSDELDPRSILTKAIAYQEYLQSENRY